MFVWGTRTRKGVTHKPVIAEHHPLIVPSSNQPLRTPRQTISKVVFGASSFMNYVLATNTAKKLVKKAERKFNERRKKEESSEMEGAKEEWRRFKV